MPTLFISDLHLNGDRSPADKLFQQFLNGPATQADALYILGDLFEVWLGDDLIPPEHQAAITGLRRLTDGGVSVYLMHGNRDFLISEDLARQTGCTLLPDPCTINLDGTPTLLMHGDLLCTDDLPYQHMRRQLRDPSAVAAFLQKTPAERITYAQKLRETSREETGRKHDYEMDVNDDTVALYMQQHRVSQLIHGHTHRPARHALSGGGQRLVLGAWDSGSAQIARCDEHGCRLETFSG